MISYFASQGRHGDVQDGDIIGRVRVSNGLFQVQGAGQEQQEHSLSQTQETQESVMDVVETIAGESAPENGDEVPPEQVTLQPDADTVQTHQAQAIQVVAAEEVIAHQAPDQQAELVHDHALEEPELVMIEERVRPQVPAEEPPGPSTQGWESIRKLGGWKAFLVECPMLEEVNEQHKGAWCTAWALSLRWWKEATSNRDRETALLWLSFWPQGLQRKPIRGGRQGRVELSSRYNCVLEEDWEGLVERWERDRQKRSEKHARRGSRPNRSSEEYEEREVSKQRRIVVGLIQAGQLGKAMGRVTSFGLGDIRDQAVKDQLSEKFPPRQRPLPESVSKLRPIDSFRNLRGSLLSLSPGTAAGAGGIRNEYLVALGERMEEQEIKLLEDFGMAYSAGELPSWFYRVFQTLQTVAPYKDRSQEAVRPLGLKNSMIKMFNKDIMAQSKTEVRDFLEPVQLGISIAGPALLTRSVSGVLQAFPDFICFRLDLKNAFNEMSRRAILDVLNSEESLKHLVTFAAAILAPVAALETGGEVWGETAEGVGQGDPPSGDFFSVGLHPDLLELDRACREGGGQARAGHDDVFAQGPANVVIPAVERFARSIWERCHLKLQWNKSHIFTWDGILPEGTPEGVGIAGKTIDGVLEVGFDCYGVPMGTDKYVKSELMVMASEVAEDAKKTRELLNPNKQALWATLRLSTTQRFQFLCQHVHPSLCEPVAEWLDSQLWRELEATVGFDIPQGYRGQEGDVALDVPVAGLNGRSFQEWAVRLPVKMHGWGFRSLRATCIPAYIGTLETSIPRMKDISPIMVNTWGGTESWGAEAPTASRWSAVLESGCREGVELERAWEILTREARESADWLGTQVDPVFSVPLSGLGDGSVSGNTRGDIVAARERTRAQLLTKALSLYLPKKARPAWAWKQRDKISSSWLLALPGADSTLSNAEFAEAAATSLCLPSPACMGRVGETVKGRKVIDQYGDQVQATALPGDHWRQRHDQLKHVLHRLCIWAGLPCEIEVFNIFSRHIPQAGLARIDRHRDRQGMVPDMKITLTTAGVSRQVLHEIKCISSSQSRYKPSWSERGVDKRAEQLHQEYVEKARRADQQHGGVEQGVVGPVERKLLTFPKVEGIVFGNWGETSQATHHLVEELASSRARIADSQRGRRGQILSEEGVKGLAVGYIRRKLSIAAVKAQCHSLLGRLEGLGPGAVAAAGRRARAMEQERLWARERMAYDLSVKQGFNIIRRGFAKVD